MTTEFIQHQLTDNVLQITLNRAEKKNALTQAMYSEMAQLVNEAQNNDQVACIFLTGHTDCFCAGNDIQDFIQAPSLLEDNPILHFLHALAHNEKPFVVAANGPCVGIGATVLLHCDLVYLGENALLKMPFVDLGLCPEAGASLLLPRMIGVTRAAELLLLGNSLNAETAKSWGLVNEVAASDRYQSLALEAAKTLASKPANALKISRALIREHLNKGLIEQINKEAKEFSACLKSPEAMTAFMKFMSKK